MDATTGDAPSSDSSAADATVGDVAQPDVTATDSPTAEAASDASSEAASDAASDAAFDAAIPDGTIDVASDTGTTSDALGGTVVVTSPDGSGITYPQGALVTASGGAPTLPISVTVTMVIGPSSDPQAMPGGFAGMSAAGQVGALASFGAISVAITDAQGQPLDLAPGSTGTVTIPAIPGGPSTLPLWYLDTASNVWQQLGTATLNAAGSAYVGVVPHFSYWNVDIWCSQACLQGTVTGMSNANVSGAQVSAVVQSSTCASWSSGALAGGVATTDANGNYQISNLPGPSTVLLTITKGGATVTQTVQIPAAGSTCVNANVAMCAGGMAGGNTCQNNCNVGVTCGTESFGLVCICGGNCTCTRNSVVTSTFPTGSTCNGASNMQAGFVSCGYSL